MNSDLDLKKCATVLAIACNFLTARESEAAIGILVERGGAYEGAAFDGDVSSSDLINVGSEALASVSSTPFFFIEGVNDGTPGQAEVLEGEGHYSATVDFNLDTSINTAGYDLTTLTTITGAFFELSPPEDYVNSYQSYTVSYSVVGDAGFEVLATVFETDDDPVVPRMMKVTLIGLASEASGVDVVRFTWLDPLPITADTGTAIREIDVHGTPTQIPEPTAGLFLVLGLGIALLRLPRRR